MPDYLVITKLPQQQTLLGVKPPSVALDEAIDTDLAGCIEGVHVPEHGEVLIVPKSAVTTVSWDRRRVVS